MPLLHNNEKHQTTMKQKGFHTHLKNILILVLPFLAAALLPAQSTTHQYQATSALIANPERGWYDDYYSHSGGANLGTTYHPLSRRMMVESRVDDKITLVLRLFYLHEFLELDQVSAEYLQRMQSDFDSIRAAGVKCIVRFAYSASQSAAVWDATPEKVFSHIESLREVLQANGDIIAGVQAGFIGAWGEWYYTKNFAKPGFGTDSTHQANRRTLVEKLLEILPEHVSVQGRTPAIMKNLAGTTDPISAEEAFDGSFKSRIGHHNDCFLADATDYGTYTKLEADLAYLGETTKYTITGGETCDASNNYSDCVNSIPRMSELHWTYLNRDYNRAVYRKWEEQGCLGEVDISLGYRISLVSATLADSAVPGSPVNLSFRFLSSGYAAPTQYKPIQVVLTHTVTGERSLMEYSGTNDDIRFWLPGEIQSEGTVDIPAGLPEGNYTVALRFPDKDPQLAENPAYSIQLANAGTWEEESGINLLHHIVTVGSGGEGSLPLAPADLEATTVSETQIDLTWSDGSDDETGFEIMRAEGEGNSWESLVTLDPDVETFSDTVARKGTYYSYIIRAVNGYGASAWSDSATAATLGVSVQHTNMPSMEIFPNPLKGGNLTIRFGERAERQVQITTLSGMLIYTTSTRETNLEIDRGLFRTGVYLVTLTRGNDREIRKLVVL